MTVKLNLLPLGTYDILIGMDLLAIHITQSNCFEKLIECLNNDSERMVMQSKWKLIIN